MWNRRAFLRMTGGVLGPGAVVAKSYGIDEVAAATQAVAGRSPTDLAQDEDYWRESSSPSRSTER